jgi:hypothetical protein
VEDPFAGHRITLHHGHPEAAFLALLQKSVEALEEGVFVGVAGPALTRTAR